MSDRGIPATYRHMHGFGSHTFSFINAKNERYWVTFHLKSQQGIQNLTDAEAELIDVGVMELNRIPKTSSPMSSNPPSIRPMCRPG